MKKMKDNSSKVSFYSSDKLSYDESCLFYSLVLKVYSLEYDVNNNILSVFPARQKRDD